jgi:hypothetical protein
MIEYNYVRPKKNITNFQGWIVCYEGELYPITSIDEECKMYHIQCEDVDGYPTFMALEVYDTDFYFLDVDSIVEETYIEEVALEYFEEEDGFIE